MNVHQFSIETATPWPPLKYKQHLLQQQVLSSVPCSSNKFSAQHLLWAAASQADSSTTSKLCTNAFSSSLYSSHRDISFHSSHDDTISSLSSQSTSSCKMFILSIQQTADYPLPPAQHSATDNSFTFSALPPRHHSTSTQLLLIDGLLVAE